MFKFKPVTIEGMKFKAVSYHRNGVTGEGFFCAVANDKNGDMLITLFPEQTGCCAVFAIGRLPNIEFTENSWRGDHYESAMREAVKAYRKQMDTHYELNK